MSLQNKSNTRNPETSESALAYKIASTSRWEIKTLFISFMKEKPVEIILDVHARRRYVSWDLKAIQHLRDCLKTWVQDGIPGDAIGAFLVNVLYERDYHLDYRLTTMVWERQTQLHIARHVLAFYQIRDEAGRPLWNDVTVYQDRAVAKARPKKAIDIPRIPMFKLADPRWALFLNGLNHAALEDIMDKLGEDSLHLEEKDLPILFNEVSENDIPVIESFRSCNIHRNDCSEDFLRLDERENPMKQSSRPEAMPLPLPTRQSFPRQAGKPLSLPSNEKLLPLPPVSAKTRRCDSVHVWTFKARKNFNIRFALDTKPSIEISANSVHNQTPISFSLSNSPVNLNKGLPASPLDPDFGTCLRKIYTDNSARRPALRKIQGCGNLRKARELDTA